MFLKAIVGNGEDFERARVVDHNEQGSERAKGLDRCKFQDGNFAEVVNMKLEAGLRALNWF